MVKKVTLLFIIFTIFSSINIRSQTDTSYENMLRRLKSTVPYTLSMGGGFGYKSYLSKSEFERLWAELVPEKPEANYSSFSNLGFELEGSVPISNNLAAGVIVSQAIKTISNDYIKTSSGEYITYFGKQYYLPAGENKLSSELGLGAINLGVSLAYFPFKKGQLGIKFLTPFIEAAYGISFLRGKFVTNPFGVIERFSKVNPVYVSLGIGSVLSSYTYWAGITLKLNVTYSQFNEVLTTEGKPIKYNDGSVFKAKLNNFGISLIGNFIFN